MGFADGAESVTVRDLIVAGTPPEPEPEDEDDSAKVAREPEGLAWTEALNNKGVTRNEMAAKIKVLFEALDDDEDHIVTKREFVRALIEDGHSKTDALRLFKEIDNTGSH